MEQIRAIIDTELGAVGVISYRSYYLDDFPDLIAWDPIWTISVRGL